MLFGNILDDAVALVHGEAGKVQNRHQIFLIQNKGIWELFCLNQIINDRNAVIKRNAALKCGIHGLETGADGSNKSGQLRNVLRFVTHEFLSGGSFFALVDTAGETAGIDIPDGWIILDFF